jgi:hypothetical protein
VITRLRSTGKVAPNLPYGLGSILSPSDATYLYEADKFDPQALASSLTPRTPVLVSCSNADLQVSCSQTDEVVQGLTKAHALLDYVRLKGVDHVLKQDPTGAAANYTKALPFSKVLRGDIKQFVMLHL